MGSPGVRQRGAQLEEVRLRHCNREAPRAIEELTLPSGATHQLHTLHVLTTLKLSLAVDGESAEDDTTDRPEEAPGDGGKGGKA